MSLLRLLAPFKLVPADGPAVQAAKRLDQRRPGGQKDWLCTLGGETRTVRAATRGEARARLKEALKIPKKGRLPDGWVLTLS